MDRHDFDIRVAKVEGVAEAYKFIENRIHDVTTTYQVVERAYEQEKDWRTGELVWEDEDQTVPKMKDRWDYVAIPEDELTEEIKLKVEAYNLILKDLEKLI